MKSILLALLITISLNAHYLLQSPQSITYEEIQKIPHCWTGVWRGKHGFYMLNFDEERVGFKIVFFESIPDGIEEAKFKTLEKDNRKEFEYVTGYFDPRMEEESSKESKNSYYLAKPLDKIITDNKPQALSLEHCLNFIKNKNVVFYTGAGISATADIFTMGPLMANLGIDNASSTQFVQNVLYNPEKPAAVFREFCIKAFTAPATDAHKALTEIALYKKTSIVTENFDLLHEQTGIKPIHIKASDMQDNVTPQELQQIDAIICIGLSHDDRGFLSWYKQHNPRGIIIAVDLKTPTYLSSNDYIIQGDLQMIMPSIRNVLCN